MPTSRAPSAPTPARDEPVTTIDWQTNYDLAMNDLAVLHAAAGEVVRLFERGKQQPDFMRSPAMQAAVERLDRLVNPKPSPEPDE